MQRFLLDTASADGLGAVLSQVVGGREHVIAYASRTLTRADEKKCWPSCGHHTISDLIFTEGNLYCELTIVHCSGFIVSKSQRARWQDG